MKLGELRSAIRGHKGTVRVQAVLGGKVVQIPVQKTGFLGETLEAFGDHKNIESGLTLTEEGILIPELDAADDEPVNLGEDTVEAPTVDDDLLGDSGSETGVAEDDLDDLLG